MKHLRKRAPFVFVLFCILISIGCKTARRQTADKAQTSAALLWKIEKDKSNTSFLFGTIHMIDADQYFFTPEMDSALSQSDGLVLEIDLENAMDLGSQMGLLQKAFMRNDTTLKDLLTDDEYLMVQDHFLQMGIPIFLFERVKPMFLTIFASEDLFSDGGLDMEAIKSYELELIEKVKAKNKPVAGLETVEYQMGIFDSIPYGAQADMLVASLSDGDQDDSTMDTLVYYYKSQDLRKLDELLNSDPTTKNYKSVLLDNRNRNWIPIMEEMMQESSRFFAVGAGHLSGEFGVIQLLRNQGFKVSPVPMKISMGT